MKYHFVSILQALKIQVILNKIGNFYSKITLNSLIIHKSIKYDAFPCFSISSILERRRPFRAAQASLRVNKLTREIHRKSISIPQFMAMPLYDGRGQLTCYCMVINGRDFVIKWQ